MSLQIIISLITMGIMTINTNQVSGRSLMINVIPYPKTQNQTQQFINGSCLGGNCQHDNRNQTQQFINGSCLGGNCETNQTKQFINGSCLGGRCGNYVSNNSVTLSINTMNSSCATCMVLTGLVELDLLAENNSIPDAYNFIDNICNLTHNPTTGYCLLVLHSIKRISQMAHNGTNISSICQDIGSC